MLEKLPSAIGLALQDRRAGLENIAFNLIDLRAGTAAINVSSLAFGDHEAIPGQYTADGAGTSPPLEWTGIPETADSVALLVEDADAPTPHPLVHAIVVALPPTDGRLMEDALGDDDALHGDIGRNSYLQTGWLPPDPPPGHGVHRYAFQVFALAGATLPKTPGREAVLKAIEEHGIASGCLIGTYERPDGSIKIPASSAIGIAGNIETPSV